MKKLYLVLIAIIIASNGFAQILDAPIVNGGDLFTYSVTDTVAPGEAGENMVWDYMNLGFIQSYNGQILPSVPSPYQDDYPDASWIWEMGGGHYYYNLGPDLYEYFGGVENGASYPYLDSEEFYPYPFEYGQTHQDSAINTVSIMGMETFRSIFTTSAFDGYGILNMPNEVSYDDVCRIRIHRNITDSTIAGISNITIDQIAFLQNGLATPIVSHINLEITSEGGVETYSIMEYLQSYISGTDEVELDLFAMFPNPASKTVTLKWASSVESIIVYDLTGREVYSVNVIPGITITQFDVSNWAPGVYSAYFTSGGTKTTEKLVVE